MGDARCETVCASGCQRPDAPLPTRWRRRRFTQAQNTTDPQLAITVLCGQPA